jgi:hypothetical protein
MGPRNHHTAQEGVKSANQLQNNSKDAVKMLEETGTKVHASTVK